MSGYPFKEIERRWQRFWEEHRTFEVREDPSVPPERRRYVLDMFPYPSGDGLHMGHPEGYTATDIYCRYLRMQGFLVLHPMGFDSFGLPAETYAIKTGRHPRETTEQNIDRFRVQIKSLGFSYDWSREVSTHTPDYFRWTQWIFLKLYERGLAYMAKVPVWYCEALGTVLANEEVLLTDEGPRSERGNHPVVRKPLRQWMLRITQYAERLLNGLEELDWPESIKTMQRNWIGRSEGARVKFRIPNEAASNGAADQTADRDEAYIEVFTTRPDTLCGATYMVLAPEHPSVQDITTEAQREAVEQYIAQARNKSDLERTDFAKEKSGVFSGAYAVNPVNDEPVPVWIADYVLSTYGTGAIMAVPAHDERDFEFAQRYRLPIVSVYGDVELPFVGDGVMTNSGEFSGMSTAEGKERITAWLAERGMGEKTVNYKLRDWIFSRQRYWGEPIPILHTDEIIPLSEEELPLQLPEVEKYGHASTGESPLALIEEWVDTNTSDGIAARRETNTMPQWAGSCWYYLRFLDPHNKEVLASREKVEYWMPVDLYVGGAEHAVLHLLYARFWHKVLYDIGVVNTEEPFRRLVNQGMILGENGVKMSKSMGNVVNPDEIIGKYGADSLRVYEMFMGPLQMVKPWSTRNIGGVLRFFSRIWNISDRVGSDEAPPQHLIRLLHQTIQKVTEDTETLSFNTAIAQMMIFINGCYKEEKMYQQLWDPFVRLLSPYAPHLAEELWVKLGNDPSIAYVPWPQYDRALTKSEVCTVVVQINGKVRTKIEMPAGMAKNEMEAAARSNERISTLLEGKTILKIIVVPDKIVNIVVK